MSIYREIDDACSLIKHASEIVNLDDLHGLLRRAQYQLQVVSALVTPDFLEVDRSSIGTSTEITVRVSVDEDEVSGIVTWLNGDEE